jgi:hypothetical protein
MAQTLTAWKDELVKKACILKQNNNALSPQTREMVQAACKGNT